MTRINPYKFFYGVPTNTLRRSKRSFIPGGPIIKLERFQDTLGEQGRKLLVSLSIIHQYRLYPKVILGDGPILEAADGALLAAKNRSVNEILMSLSIHKKKGIGIYLYESYLHPLFFAEVLNLIAHRAIDLDRDASEICLRALNRRSIAFALNRGVIRETDIGTRFEFFPGKSVEEKFAILTKLGVIKFRPGRSLGDIFPAARQLSLTARPAGPTAPEPRPPIVVAITEAPGPRNIRAVDRRGQYLLFGPEAPKKRKS